MYLFMNKFIHYSQNIAESKTTLPSNVVIFSWPSASSSKMEPLEYHLNTCGSPIGLRNQSEYKIKGKFWKYYPPWPLLYS